jgi:hypothetical protein
MLATIDRLAELDLPVDRAQAAAVRAYMHDWVAELGPTKATSPSADRKQTQDLGREAEHG